MHELRVDAKTSQLHKHPVAHIVIANAARRLHLQSMFGGDD
jgi:hypothetical protein